jgi:transcriptional regulator with XRE-family HTH domain
VPRTNRPPTSPYTPEENDKLRAALHALMDAKGWTQMAAAGFLGISQQTVSSFLGGRSGAGRPLVRAIERLTGKSEAELLGKADGAVPFRSRPGWDAAVTRAQAMFPRVPEYAFKEIGSWSGGAAGIAPDPVVLGRLALDWWDTASDEVRSRALTAHALDEMAAEDEADEDEERAVRASTPDPGRGYKVAP